MAGGGPLGEGPEPSVSFTAARGRPRFDLVGTAARKFTRPPSMRLPSLPPNTQAAVAAALLSVSLTAAPPAFCEDAIFGAAGEFTKANEIDGGYRGSVPGQDKQFAAGAGKGAEKAENSKIQGGGASTLQGGRRITITRGVNLDNTNWKGEDLRGVAFQQSVVRSANFEVMLKPSVERALCSVLCSVRISVRTSVAVVTISEEDMAARVEHADVEHSERC